jgi:tRNA threonylcarbamoyladenosine biosynthesis protein TsaE
MRFFLHKASQTLTLAHEIAEAIRFSHMFFPILFQGPLGTGKTTFVRGLVETFPGGDQAEVSSPSFNLVNIYPTQPEIIHMDLYRISQTGLDECLLEYLNFTESLIMIEWIEYLPQNYWPEMYLKINLSFRHTGRECVLKPHGECVTHVINLLQRQSSTYNL